MKVAIELVRAADFGFRDWRVFEDAKGFAFEDDKVVVRESTRRHYFPISNVLEVVTEGE